MALLELGESTVLPISKKADFKRTHCYEILDNLASKGLVYYFEKNNRRRYVAEDPKKIKEMMTQRLKHLDEFLPELRSIYNQSKVKPKIKFFEGEEGLLAAQYDTLTLPKDSEILAYASAGGIYYQKVAGKYIPDRIKKNISVRALIPDTKETREITKYDREQLRTSRLLPPEKFPFTNEIDIYGNKIAIISYQKEFIAIIIESESVANTQRAIFELAWEGAEKYQKK